MMTYYDIIKGIGDCALEEPNVNYFGHRNIYDLNSIPNIDYGVVYVTPNTHTITEDTIIYSLNIYYIDRWDESEENQLLIHNKAIFSLSNILNRFNMKFPEVGIRYNGSITLFYQKFKDETAGAFMTIQIEVPREYECYDYEN